LLTQKVNEIRAQLGQPLLEGEQEVFDRELTEEEASAFDNAIEALGRTLDEMNNKGLSPSKET
jgi:primosomal protein N''